MIEIESIDGIKDKNTFKKMCRKAREMSKDFTKEFSTWNDIGIEVLIHFKEDSDVHYGFLDLSAVNLQSLKAYTTIFLKPNYNVAVKEIDYKKWFAEVLKKEQEQEE